MLWFYAMMRAKTAAAEAAGDRERLQNRHLSISRENRRGSPDGGFIIEYLTQKVETKYGEGLEITGAAAPGARLWIPAEIGGLPVVSIGDHAFSGLEEIREARLPESVREVKDFAFYYCRNLERLTLSDGVKDYHHGVTKQCRALRRIDVTFAGDSYGLLRDIMSDNEYRLTFDLHFPDGDARLTMPDYTYIYQEDTMARAIHFHIEGAGFSYRECVKRGKIDFHGYDSLFARAVVDDPATAADMAFDRLMVPYQLAEEAKEAYRAYLKESAGVILPGLAEAGEEEKVRFLAGEDLLEPEAVEGGLAAAARMRKTEISAILMEYQSRQAAPRRAAGRLEL